MAGGNRAFTLQDVLGQLNQDASGQSSQDDSALQINQLAVLSDGVAATDSVTVTTGAAEFYWNASGAYWGSQEWGWDYLDGGNATSTYGTSDVIDGGNATSTYATTGNIDGGSA